jgi:hypothetical protein
MKNETQEGHITAEQIAEWKKNLKPISSTS